MLTHILSHDLPNDVFDEGEVKPSKPMKKKVMKKRNATTDVCSESVLSMLTWAARAKRLPSRPPHTRISLTSLI